MTIEGYCCGVMAAELERECTDHPEPFDCPDHIVYYSKQLYEYGILIHDGGSSYSLINYCPWCGTKLASLKNQDE
jgi:hypothetical protein